MGVNVKKKKTVEEPLNVICFGDSITHAANFGEGDRWPTILQFHLDRWKPGAYRVFNLGIGGNTSAQGFDRFSQVDQRLPGIVLIEFGFNDATVREPSVKSRVSLPEFKRNMLEFARMIRHREGSPVFIVNHTIGPKRFLKEGQGNGRAYAMNFAPYNAAIRTLAKQSGAPMIDLPEMMKKRKIHLPSFLSDDDLHLSAAGNHLYAEMVFDQIRSI
jgi:lysophospholipase L1-like esterase